MERPQDRKEAELGGTTMTSLLKRIPRPMTSKELDQYRELRADLMAQAELIMSVFCPLFGDRQRVTEVKFDEGNPRGSIDIYYSTTFYGEDDYDCVSFPESYLGMTEDELKAEKARIKEEEERKKAERAAKAKAAREKRKAEREAAKKAKEKEERYRMFLELSAQFEGKGELGHWGFLKYDEACCSKCGHVISLPFHTTKEAKEKWNTELPNYCEECGSKMEKELECVVNRVGD